MNRRALLAVVAMLESGCSTTGSGADMSWLGGLVGGILGFALFFLVVFLTAKGRL